jgi:hypothetical protein
MSDLKNDDQKAMMQSKEAPASPKTAEKVDKKAISQSAVKGSTAQNAHSKKVGYGYGYATATDDAPTADPKVDPKQPADSKVDPKKTADSKVEPKADSKADSKKPADPSVTPAPTKIATQRQLKKIADASAVDPSKKPIGPDGVKPKDSEEKATASSQSVSQLNNKNAKLRKIDDTAPVVAPSADAKAKADKEPAEEKDDVEDSSEHD